MLLMFTAAARRSAWDPLAHDTWIKWDSGHYLTIAARGYEFMSCAELPDYNPAHWCGNAGWFPGYPMVLRLAHDVTGEPMIWVAILTSQGFTLAALMLVWNLFLERRNPVLLALCAFAPGTYYFVAGFPISMAVCFMLIALWASREGRHGVALASGVFAGLTYPSSVWLSGLFAAGLVAARSRGERPPGAAWLVAAGPVLGFAMVLLGHQLALGRWDAFFLTQEKYGHGFINPAAVLWDRSRYIWVWRPGWQIGIQSLVAATIVIASAVMAAVAARRRASVPGQSTLALYGLTYWLIPLATSGVSSYRAEALLMPAVIGLRRLPASLLVLLLLAAGGIWFVMAGQFVEGWLV